MEIPEAKEWEYEIICQLRDVRNNLPPIECKIELRAKGAQEAMIKAGNMLDYYTNSESNGDVRFDTIWLDISRM